MSPLVEVDAPGGCGAVEMVKGDGSLEDVVVAVVFCESRFGAGNFEEIAELREEKSVIGPFCRGGVLPSLNEALVGRGHKRMFS